MAESNWRARIGATPGKLALVVLMAVIFVYVLIIQFGGEEATAVAPREARPANLRRQSRLPAAATLETSEDAQTGPAHAKKPWPQFTKVEIVGHDPFALPDSLAMPIASASSIAQESSAEDWRRDEHEQKRRQTLAELKKKGVNVVVLGERVQAATIGGRTVRVGEVVDGFRVTEIRRDGVVLVEVK